MSREIKFRAWHKINKEWTSDPIIDGENGKMMAFSMLDAQFVRHYRDDEMEIMQYTGLKDKNSKEIYEGDIVEYNDFNSLRTGGHAEDKIIVGKVTFGCGMWMVEEKNCGHDLYEGLVNDEELEVIGNIYENPELLEETA